MNENKQDKIHTCTKQCGKYLITFRSNTPTEQAIDNYAKTLIEIAEEMMLQEFKNKEI